MDTASITSDSDRHVFQMSTSELVRLVVRATGEIPISDTDLLAMALTLTARQQVRDGNLYRAASNLPSQQKGGAEAGRAPASRGSA